MFEKNINYIIKCVSFKYAAFGLEATFVFAII